MTIPDWEIELNGHIEIFMVDDGWDEFVPFLVAKQMIAEREQRIADLQAEVARLAGLVAIHFPNATMPPVANRRAG